MTGYEKKIAYFDLMENGQRIGNAGFVKVIVQNGQLRLTTNISGLHKTDTLKTEIFFTKGEKDIVIDTMHIKEGRCIYSRLLKEDELKSLGAEWGKIYSVCIHLGETRKLTAVINPSAKVYVEENTERLMVSEEHLGQGSEITEHFEEQPEVKEASEESIVLKKDTCDYKKENDVWVHDDKWKQLEATFPHVHPFGDAREYLSVKPKDFVVLTKAYQCLANNSFLLHGFYNYHHVILGKISERAYDNQNADKFYIGVPGVFYEREKAVALMFGFESFECGKETAEAGTFGYYMKRVEI